MKLNCHTENAFHSVQTERYNYIHLACEMLLYIKLYSRFSLALTDSQGCQAKERTANQQLICSEIYVYMHIRCSGITERLTFKSCIKLLMYLH